MPQVPAKLKDEMKKYVDKGLVSKDECIEMFKMYFEKPELSSFPEDARMMKAWLMVRSRIVGKAGSNAKSFVIVPFEVSKPAYKKWESGKDENSGRTWEAGSNFTISINALAKAEQSKGGFKFAVIKVVGDTEKEVKSRVAGVVPNKMFQANLVEKNKDGGWHELSCMKDTHWTQKEISGDLPSLKDLSSKLPFKEIKLSNIKATIPLVPKGKKRPHEYFIFDGMIARAIHDKQDKTGNQVSSYFMIDNSLTSDEVASGCGIWVSVEASHDVFEETSEIRIIGTAYAYEKMDDSDEGRKVIKHNMTAQCIIPLIPFYREMQEPVARAGGDSGEQADDEEALDDEDLFGSDEEEKEGINISSLNF